MSDPVRRLVGKPKKRIVEETAMEWTLSGLSDMDVVRLRDGLKRLEVELDGALCSQGCGPNVKWVSEELVAVENLRHLVEQGVRPPASERKTKP